MRWRGRKKRLEDEEDVLTFEGLLESDDDEEEDDKPRRRYAPPRPIRTRFHSDGDDDEEPDGPTFEELEPKIRAGKYRPKSGDPWTAHILYQSLRDLGDI